MSSSSEIPTTIWTIGGATNLAFLLRNMKPILNENPFVFCTISPEKLQTIDTAEIVGLFRESEGITLVLNKEYANKISKNLKSSSENIYAWLTLEVHSSLEAVGLTAAFAAALTKANISCNVIAGFYHDHIFVPFEQGNQAKQVLEELAASA